MRKFQKFNAATVKDPNIRAALEAISMALAELNGAVSKVAAGNSPDSTGAPLVRAVAALAQEAIDALTIAHTDTTNTFTEDQTVQGDIYTVRVTASDFVEAVALRVAALSGTSTISGTLLTEQRAHELPDVDGTFIVDAPSDGVKYCRKDGAWVVV